METDDGLDHLSTPPRQRIYAQEPPESQLKATWECLPLISRKISFLTGCELSEFKAKTIKEPENVIYSNVKE